MSDFNTSITRLRMLNIGVPFMRVYGGSSDDYGHDYTADINAVLDYYMYPRYRPPQPSDDGRWCFLEELPSDAPPTLVVVRNVTCVDDQGYYRRDEWQYWTLAGRRELTGGVWPCERPEVGK